MSFPDKRNHEEGATMVEYGIMVALIAAVCIVMITTVGTDVLGLYSSVKW